MPQDIRPDSAHYAADCRQIARSLDPPNSDAVYVRLVDRSTTYHLILVPIDAAVQYGVPPVKGKDWIVVNRIGHGSYWFDLAGFVAPNYITEKLRLDAGGDGEAIAEFLARLGAARKVKAV